MREGWGKPKDAAIYAGTSLRTFRDWLKMGLPHSKIRGSIFIEYSELDKWMSGLEVDQGALDRLVDEVLRDF